MPKTATPASATTTPSAGAPNRPIITVLDVASGLPSHFMGEITDSSLVFWKYPKAVKGSPGYFTASRLTITPDDSDVNNGAPIVAYYKVADCVTIQKDGSERPGLIPSIDGLEPPAGIDRDNIRLMALDGTANYLEDGEEDLFAGRFLAYMDPQHPIKVPGGAPWVEFKDFSVKNGLPVDFFAEGDWHALNGVRGFFERVERKERKVRDGEEPAAKKQFKDELLVMTQYEEPAAAMSKAAPASRASKPATAAASTGSSAASTTPAATSASTASPAEPSELEGRFMGWVMSLVPDGGALTKMQLISKVPGGFKGAELKPALALAQNKEFLGTFATVAADGSLTLG
jgi:hypothetical protein